VTVSLAPAGPTCPCCHLPQPEHRDPRGFRSLVCQECERHQGESVERRISRAERHEQLVRERLIASRALVERLEWEAMKAQDMMKAVIVSRGGLASWIVREANMERRHTCALHAIAFDREVQKWASRSDELG